MPAAARPRERAFAPYMARSARPWSSTADSSPSQQTTPAEHIDIAATSWRSPSVRRSAISSVQSGSTTLWNGEVGYAFSDRTQLVLEGYNLFDADASDIDYFYASRLPGEPYEGLEDIHTHPALPRSVRLALRVGF